MSTFLRNKVPGLYKSLAIFRTSGAKLKNDLKVRSHAETLRRVLLRVRDCPMIKWIDAETHPFFSPKRQIDVSNF
jgi:hypothetical protein